MQERHCGTFSVFVSVASLILTAVSFSSADAQQVINPSFELPVAGPPNNFIEDPPTTQGVGWQFSGPAGSKNVSGVQKNGSSFNAPATTDGQQSAFILNFGTISQVIEFKKGGGYQLSFKIAAQAGSKLPDQILAGFDEHLGGYSPPNNTSFTTITIPLHWQLTAGKHTLKFQGANEFAGGLNVVFIDDVAIKPVTPEITKGPEGDLDPYSTVTLTVKNAGTEKGKVRIHFPRASAVTFDNSTSKDNLDLDVPGTWNDSGADSATITTEQILQASSRGAVDEQTVDITVIASNGQESKPVQAKFHNKAVITSVSGKMVPSGKRIPKGWNFGNAAGKVTAMFLAPSFVPFPDSNGSKTNLDVTIQSWSPAVIKAQFQSIVGVLEQVVLISLTTKDGRQSNVFPAGIFTPTIELRQLSESDSAVTVIDCGTDSFGNWCNSTNTSGSVCLDLPSLQFIVDQPTLSSVISFGGAHIHCWSAASANGLDSYKASVTNGWVIDGLSFWPQTHNDPNWEDNATVNYLRFLIPSPTPTLIIVNVSWHIGATGGIALYHGSITVKGPKGVPYN
jgi:hypothetical protein